MKKLSTLTRRENCFYTIDGQTVCTIQELHDYLMNCPPESYAHHANEQKNDFAKWIHDVLLFPELSAKLFGTKTVDEARTELKTFTQSFDYKSKNISEEMSFVTIDEYRLKNIQELYYYLLNCDDVNYAHHVNAEHNDFAKWINDIWQLPALGHKVQMSKSRPDMINLLKDFLINGLMNDVQEYENYINARIIHEDAVAKMKKEQSQKEEQARQADEAQQENKQRQEEEAKKASQAMEEKGPNGEERITVNPHILDRPDEFEEEKNTAPTLDGSKFHSFSDEELEKFTKFSKGEKEVAEADVRIDYMKAAMNELQNMIRELRRMEKDALVADLLLRSVTPKIEYYNISKNIDDYNHIIRIMKEVQHEIEEASVQQQHNLAEDIYKELRLQGIAMKKA